MMGSDANRVLLIDFIFNIHGKKTFEWVSDEYIQKLFLIEEKPNWSGHIDYCSKILKDTSQQMLAILFESEHVGNCGIKNIDHLNNSCELWLYVGKKTVYGHGVGTSVTNNICERAKNLGMKMVYLHVAEFNCGAIALYQKCGFKRKSMPTKSDWKNRDVEIVYMEKKLDE